MIRARTALAAVALLGTVGVAGCGGGHLEGYSLHRVGPAAYACSYDAHAQQMTAHLHVRGRASGGAVTEHITVGVTRPGGEPGTGRFHGSTTVRIDPQVNRNIDITFALPRQAHQRGLTQCWLTDKT